MKLFSLFDYLCQTHITITSFIILSDRFHKVGVLVNYIVEVNSPMFARTALKVV